MKKTLFTETFRILFILELIYSLYAKMKDLSRHNGVRKKRRFLIN